MIRFIIILFIYLEGLSAGPWSWKIALSGGEWETNTSTIRMYQRAVRDAWEEEKVFVPELFYGNYFYPRKTRLSFESSSIKLNLEYKVSNSHRIYTGLDYTRLSLDQSTNQNLINRRILSLFFTQGLSQENLVRGGAYIANSFLEPTSFYTPVIGYRYVVLDQWIQYYFRTQFGAGSCVRGPTCNVARAELALGGELVNFPFSLEVYFGNTVQTQELIRFNAREVGFGLGYRFGD
jgi:hypothetical protein